MCDCVTYCCGTPQARAVSHHASVFGARRCRPHRVRAGQDRCLLLPAPQGTPCRWPAHITARCAHRRARAHPHRRATCGTISAQLLRGIVFWTSPTVDEIASILPRRFKRSKQRTIEAVRPSVCRSANRRSTTGCGCHCTWIHMSLAHTRAGVCTRALLLWCGPRLSVDQQNQRMAALPMEVDKLFDQNRARVTHGLLIKSQQYEQVRQPTPSSYLPLARASTRMPASPVLPGTAQRGVAQSAYRACLVARAISSTLSSLSPAWRSAPSWSATCGCVGACGACGSLDCWHHVTLPPSRVPCTSAVVRPWHANPGDQLLRAHFSDSVLRLLPRVGAWYPWGVPVLHLCLPVL